MKGAREIALAFIARSPESASRVLAASPPSEAAAFLGEIPSPSAAKLIASLPAATAATLLQIADDKTTAHIIQDLDLPKALAIIRQIDNAARETFIARLSRRTRVAMQRSLSFAEGTVGAHLTTTLPMLTDTDTVATALDAIRESERDHINAVFVLTNTHKFAGLVTSAVALRHPERTLLSSIWNSTCHQVFAHTKLDALENDVIWGDFSFLPVINRRREVIGAISRDAARSGQTMASALPGHGPAPILAPVFSALAMSTTGLLELATTSLAKATKPEIDNDQ